MRHPRILIAALSLSATGLVGLALEEHYTDKAVIPVPGDVPTVGFGSTKREDGSPVQMGDTTTPPKALARTLAHIQKDEAGLKRCVTAPLSQAEYDLLVDHSYQYGAATTCASGVVAATNAGDYIGACNAYLRFDSMQDRSQPRLPNGKYPMKSCRTKESGCRGVWLRSQERASKCLEAQQP